MSVTDIVPAGVTLDSATASQGSCSGTTAVTCTLGTIAAGSGATITLVVTPNVPGPLSNTASVSAGAQPDSNPANDAVTSTVTVAAPIAAAEPIPTLGEWALALLAIGFAFAGAIATRR